MTSAKRVILLVVLSAPLLGSCALFNKSQMAQQSRGWVLQPREQSEFAQSQLALGHDALRESQYGAAIGYFRAVQQYPDHAPQAYNGLGIAYYNLGRPDLAQRYFQMAVAARPNDQRFSANLARLEQSLAEQRLANATSASRPPLNPDTPSHARIDGSAVSYSTLRVDIAADQSAARLVRISNGEVVVTSAAPSNAPSSGAVRRKTQYPIRIALPSRRHTRAPAAGSLPTTRVAELGVSRAVRLVPQQMNTDSMRRNTNYPVRAIINNPYVKINAANKLLR